MERIKDFGQWLCHTKLFQTKLFQNSVTKQFIKFGIVGLSNTGLSYVLYLVFLFLFEKANFFGNFDYFVSSLLTFCICTVWSFYWNNRFTFKKEIGSQRNLWSSFIKTVISYSITGLFLHNALLYVFVEWVRISKHIAPLLNLIVTVPLNFVLNKYWAFGMSDKESNPYEE